MRFEKIDSKNKSQLAAEMLLSAIESKKYLPGDKLPSERVIATEMGLSRNTLREAIAALQIVGVIDVKHGQGNYIASLDLDNLSNLDNSIRKIFASNDDPFIIIDARIAIEPGVVALACHVAAEKDIKELEVLLSNIFESIKDNAIIGYSVADYEFHMKIANCTHNHVIINTMKHLLDALKQPLWRSMKKNIFSKEEIRNSRINEHEKIFLSIKKRDPQLAQENLFSHLAESKNRLIMEIER